MSQENVEIVRRAWEASARHDNETVFELYHPDVEITFEGSVVQQLDDRVYRGIDEVRNLFRDYTEVWGEFGSEVEEWFDAGDAVIARMRNWARGRHSGLSVTASAWHVWRLRDGKLWRLRIYALKDEAFADARLSETS